MKFWYKLHNKPRGRWNRLLELGGQFTKEELDLYPDLVVNVWCAVKHTNSEGGVGYWCDTNFAGAPRWDSDRKWSLKPGYFAPSDADAAIAFAIAVRDALLERIAQARAIEPEPEIAEEFDSDALALAEDAPVRRIRLVS